MHTDRPCCGTDPPAILVLSRLVWDSVLNSLLSAPVQNLSGAKANDCSKIAWVSVWRSRHQQDILRGSDKQTLLTWPCQNLIPKPQRWNAVSHFHCLPGCWMFHDILALATGGLKLLFLMAGEYTDPASAHTQLYQEEGREPTWVSLKHRERHSLPLLWTAHKAACCTKYCIPPGLTD